MSSEPLWVAAGLLAPFYAVAGLGVWKLGAGLEEEVGVLGGFVAATMLVMQAYAILAAIA